MGRASDCAVDCTRRSARCRAIDSGRRGGSVVELEHDFPQFYSPPVIQVGCGKPGVYTLPDAAVGIPSKLVAGAAFCTPCRRPTANTNERWSRDGIEPAHLHVDHSARTGAPV